MVARFVWGTCCPGRWERETHLLSGLSAEDRAVHSHTIGYPLARGLAPGLCSLDRVGR